mmetsp:Transcript_45105/g.107241  ORF Transcript_45105/g.107241 Transcript_45105/m.107241 type:complete len:463 (-) Transcript_45105:61-1449(-)
MQTQGCSSIMLALLLALLLQHHTDALQIRTGAESAAMSESDVESAAGCPGLAQTRNLMPTLAVLHLGGNFAHEVDVPNWLQGLDFTLFNEAGVDSNYSVERPDSEPSSFSELDDLFAGSRSFDFKGKYDDFLAIDGDSASDTSSKTESPAVANDTQYYHRPSELTKAQYHWTRSLDQPVWVFSAYHKTGTVLSWKIVNHINKYHHPGDDHNKLFNKVHHTICDGDKKIFTKFVWSNVYGWPAMDVVHALPNYRLVHFIRDPVNLIISAFRYHQKGSEAWTFTRKLVEAAKENKDMTVESFRLLRHLQSQYGITRKQKIALGHFRQAAARGMTLVDFYQTAPDEEGVVVEAFRSWPMLVLVMQNYETTRRDENSLQMRMESEMADFSKSMRCMFKFLSESRHIDIKEAMRVVQPLDVTRHPHRAQSHVTSGRYDNTRITKILENMRPILAARQILNKPAVHEC